MEAGSGALLPDGATVQLLAPGEAASPGRADSSPAGDVVEADGVAGSEHSSPSADAAAAAAVTAAAAAIGGGQGSSCTALCLIVRLHAQGQVRFACSIGLLGLLMMLFSVTHLSWWYVQPLITSG